MMQKKLFIASFLWIYSTIYTGIYGEFMVVFTTVLYNGT
jgi:hypothetical protein